MSNPLMSDAARHDIAQQHNHPLKGFAVKQLDGIFTDF